MTFLTWQYRQLLQQQALVFVSQCDWITQLGVHISFISW